MGHPEETRQAPLVRLVGDSKVGLTSTFSADGVVVTPDGELLITEACTLLNEVFWGTTLDAAASFNQINRWVSQQLTSGTVTAASGRAAFTTGTGASSKASLDSQQKFAAMDSMPLLFRCIVRFVDVPVANNQRGFGFRDDAENTKVYFRLTAAGLYAAIDNGGATVYEELITDPISGYNGARYAEFWIVKAKHFVQWYIRTEERTVKVAEYNMLGRAAVITTTGPWRAYIQNANSAAAASGTTMECAAASVSLLGNAASRVGRTIRFSGVAADTVLAYGPGIIHTIYVAAIGTHVFTLVDGLTAAASTNRTLLTNGGLAAGHHIELNTFFGEGLLFDHTSGSGADLYLRVR